MARCRKGPPWAGDVSWSLQPTRVMFAMIGIGVRSDPTSFPAVGALATAITAALSAATLLDELKQFRRR
jgi:hypothetical protein